MNRLLDFDPSTADEPEWYTGCKILVTSRPTASRIDVARQRSEANYELVGFDSAQMQTFVERSLALNTKPDEQDGTATTTTAAAAELCGIIAADPDLAAACQTAYTLAMICAAYAYDRSMFGGEGGDGPMSVKLTDIYLKMARETATTNVLHRGLFGGVAGAKELSTEQRRYLLQALTGVAELARSGLGSTLRLDFAADDVGESLRDIGLLTSFECTTGEDPLTGKIKTDHQAWPGSRHSVPWPKPHSVCSIS